ncbi:lysozyme inhibitor LprI family protein [Pseudoxanthobacter soli]|uniref:lysozyme inhibitor LprI family protein n=1 Tax=Pseudoxanthobacter soli TaxID=433840 RepID=UPI0009374A4E|nr:lysozyme inhibitor LprI family protein [Pseudoxanthobacter soli]
MIWLTAVVISGAALPGKVAAASFDCGAARAADEIAICHSQALSDLDVRMATTYGILIRLVAMGQRGMLQDGQRAFLASRAACGADTACIAAAYRDRLAILDKAVDAIVSRGPY